jgi:NAD(P)H-dependent FMN reductase
MTIKPIRIPGIAGSLRRESYNRAALGAAIALVPEGAILETFISNIELSK